MDSTYKLFGFNYNQKAKVFFTLGFYSSKESGLKAFRRYVKKGETWIRIESGPNCIRWKNDFLKEDLVLRAMFPNENPRNVDVDQFNPDSPRTPR